MNIFENKKYNYYRKLISNNYKILFKKKQPESLYTPISYFLNPPGKLLRPVIFLATIEACGKKPEDYLNQAVAIELFHNFTLIHDDIMDNADIRHSKLTVHKKFDINTAILAGDNLLAISYKYLLKGITKNLSRLVSLYTDEIITICEGQSLDKDFELKQSVSVKDYYLMIKKKTASLFGLSSQIGALLSNAPENIINAFYNFGINLGLTFQLQDDLLDILAENDKFGKKIGNDIKERKKTLLYLHIVENAPRKISKELSDIYNVTEIGESEIKKVIEIYKKYGAIEFTRKEVQKYGRRASSILQIIGKNQGIDFLINLNEQLLSRTH